MKTYEEEMRERLADGRGPRRIESEEIAPGVKNLFTGRVPKGSSSVTPGTSQASVPTVPKATAPVVEMPAVLKGKDLTVDYLQSAIDKAKAGDYAGAAYDEMMHNEKNGYLGLGYENSHIFNYDDPYRGDLDRQREAIENRDPFSYDYKNDDMYKSILALKEKEADKAYKDGYAQLTRQFDGDIPVNMINKLLTTKGEIIDQADSYIPELRSLAYQMYQDEGDRMYQNYGLTQNAAAEDYNKWLTDRDFIVSGMENKYARDKYQQEFDYSKGIDERNFNYGKEIDDRNYNYQVSRDATNDAWLREQFEYSKQMNEIAMRYGVSDTIANFAVQLYQNGKASSMEKALETAKILESLYSAVRT